MSYCKNCGLLVDDKEVRCPRCGSFTEDSTCVNKGHGNVTTIVITALVIVFLAFFVVLVAFMKKDDAPVLEVTAPEKANVRDLYSTDWARSETLHNRKESNADSLPSLSELPTTSVASAIGQISYNTPGHEGLNVRAEASVHSDLIITLPEGTNVEILGGGNSEYIQIRTSFNGVLYEGYILKKYIIQ